MDGITHKYLELNNSEYRLKLARKRYNEQTPMDKLEEEVLRNIRPIIYDYYNYPYQVIPLLNKRDDYYQSVLKMVDLLNKFLKEEDKREFNDVTNEKYKKYIGSGEALRQNHSIVLNSLSTILMKKEKEVKELFDIEIYQDVYDKLCSLQQTLTTILALSDERVEERIEFYHAY